MVSASNQKNGLFSGCAYEHPDFFLNEKMDSLAVKIEALQNSVDMMNGFLHVFMGFGATLAVGFLLVKFTLRGN